MNDIHQYLGHPGFVAAVLLLVLVIQWLVFRIGTAWAARTPWGMDDAIFGHLRGPVGLLAVLFAFKIFQPGMRLGLELSGIVSRLWTLLLIAAVTWTLVRATTILKESIDRRWDISQADNLVARQVHTQVAVIRRFVVLVALVVAAALMLMTFPSVRAVGASMLASAGIAGLALGMAARPMLQNLIAGLQLALSQPIRLDDVVVVEGEWGRIEEITTTFVVIRIWDERRLILPLSYFIEKPIQTWTRTSANILATVFIYADYSLPVQALREELENIVKTSGLWDGKTVGLQVTDATGQNIQLRALFSAPDGSTAWNLRCLVREKLVEFIQKEYPHSLPRTRLMMEE